MLINNVTGLALAATWAVLMLCQAPNAAAQKKSISERFGTREPVKCSDMTQPIGKAPSNAQALQYLKCSMEKESSSLYLVKDVTVQVAPKGRRYNPLAPIPNVDTDHLIYDIRGSLELYQCEEIYSSRSNLGKNCTVYNQPQAKGACWKTSFGDWLCNMSDMNSRDRRSGVAPLQ